jgi:molybdate transport system substrate-binding protein
MSSSSSPPPERRTALLHRSLSFLVLLLAISLVGVACGGGGGKDDAAELTTTTLGKTEVTGDVTVFAASSLTEVFTALGQAFEKEHPQVKVVSNFNFAGSSALAQQVNDGAPADVFVSADEANMVKVVSAGNAGDALPIARNLLSLVVERGNPEGIAGLADLGRPGVTFAMCAPEVPCGRLGAAALARAGVRATPRSQEADVKAVLSKVTLGEVDAGIVYVTDVRAVGDKAQGVPIDIAADRDLQATYEIAVTKQVQNRGAADAWVRFVRSDAARRVFVDHGFGAP